MNRTEPYRAVPCSGKAPKVALLRYAGLFPDVLAGPGTKMDLLKKYMKRRDSEMVPEAPLPGRNRTYFCFEFYV